MKKRTILLIFCLVVLCTVLSSCTVVKFKSVDGSDAEKQSGNMTEPPAGESATASPKPAEETSSGLTWEINEFTDDVPAVDFGTIALITPSESMYFVLIENVEESDVENYGNLIVSSGFSKVELPESEAAGSSFVKDGKTVSLDYSAGTMTVLVQK
ncbi:MAG: hypothetical protein IJZ90_02620 [Clostridia bacterium]|nr:hypothetical protein [Clostridia bacterium]